VPVGTSGARPFRGSVCARPTLPGCPGRRYPRGVEVAFRVFPACELVTRLGFVTFRLVVGSRGSSTSRILSHLPCRTTRLVRRSSPGVPLSYRVLPARLAARLSTSSTSPGVRSPSAHTGGGVYVASANRSHSASYVPSSGFRTLSTASSSAHLPHLSAR